HGSLLSRRMSDRIAASRLRALAPEPGWLNQASIWFRSWFLLLPREQQRAQEGRKNRVCWRREWDSNPRYGLTPYNGLAIRNNATQNYRSLEKYGISGARKGRKGYEEARIARAARDQRRDHLQKRATGAPASSENAILGVLPWDSRPNPRHQRQAQRDRRTAHTSPDGQLHVQGPHEEATSHRDRDSALQRRASAGDARQHKLRAG